MVSSYHACVLEVIVAKVCSNIHYALSFHYALSLPLRVRNGCVTRYALRTVLYTALHFA